MVLTTDDILFIKFSVKNVFKRFRYTGCYSDHAKQSIFLFKKATSSLLNSSSRVAPMFVTFKPRQGQGELRKSFLLWALLSPLCFHLWSPQLVIAILAFCFLGPCYNILSTPFGLLESPSLISLLGTKSLGGR